MSPSTFKINRTNLDFDLPEELIAQVPTAVRDAARLMVLSRGDGSIAHKKFSDLTEFLNKGDVLVLNKAKVSRAKLTGRKTTGGKVEVILVAPMNDGVQWKALVRPLMKEGSEFVLGENARVRLEGRTPEGENVLRFSPGDLDRLMEEAVIPLPPYIKREENDRRTRQDEEDYQTIYAAVSGSLAAPTAGLHFTLRLLESLRKKGVQIEELLLNVGWGTFKPIASSVDDHRMMPETYDLSEECWTRLKKAKSEGRRIVAVGTTATRVLESLPLDGTPSLSGQTNLFIRPGFNFRWVDSLITNFHVPRSTPVSLTAAFAGFKNIEHAYEEAIREKYRFFSYGDAMLIS